MSRTIELVIVLKDSTIEENAGKAGPLRGPGRAKRAIIDLVTVHQLIPNFQDLFSSHTVTVYKW